MFLLGINFMHISVYMSIPIAQFSTPPSPAHRSFPPLMSICPFEQRDFYCSKMSSRSCLFTSLYSDSSGCWIFIPMLVASLLKDDFWAPDITDPYRIAKQEERDRVILSSRVYLPYYKQFPRRTSED